MKLWLISQTTNNEYDTYSDAVVAAETEEEAKSIHPGNGADERYNRYLPAPNIDSQNYYDWQSWVRDPKDVTATLIGTAVKGTKNKTVILASFHAG